MLALAQHALLPLLAGCAALLGAGCFWALYRLALGILESMGQLGTFVPSQDAALLGPRSTDEIVAHIRWQLDDSGLCTAYLADAGRSVQVRRSGAKWYLTIDGRITCHPSPADLLAVLRDRLDADREVAHG